MCKGDTPFFVFGGFIGVFVIIGVSCLIAGAVLTEQWKPKKYQAIPLCRSDIFDTFYSVSSFPCPASSSLSVPQPTSVSFSTLPLPVGTKYHVNLLVTSGLENANITGTIGGVTNQWNIDYSGSSLPAGSTVIVKNFDDPTSLCTTKKDCTFVLPTEYFYTYAESLTGFYLSGSPTITISFAPISVISTAPALDSHIFLKIEVPRVKSGRSLSYPMNNYYIAGIVFCVVSVAMCVVPVFLIFTIT